ncbi:alpha/beta fold hydrolase [Bacillus sp. SD088]|uniref:alpha/beta fold hydrolase n=1 Tax=Bacillus sp. SD088 TaxID=2782012 RepID=UPI001A95E879|nr:alpha/beta hydrolase [Bacillus sp. SD088]MBO0992582.1 alpha/beta hydrolase [Bacillus sp. SD088]
MYMFVKEAGDQTGPLLVFIHGGGVSGWMWNQQLDYFNEYHLLIPDLPGHGGSREESVFSIKDSAEELIRWIEMRGSDKKVIVVGFSLGAQILVEMLHQEPELIDYAVINSALVRPNSLLRGFIRPMVKFTAFLVKNRAFAQLQSKELYIDEENFETYFQESKEMKTEMLIQVLQENMNYAIPQNYPQARVEILVTIGEKEKNMMRKSAEDLVSAHPKSKGIIFPQVGHGIPLANPDLFNQTLTAWINQQPLPKELQRLHLHEIN